MRILALDCLLLLTILIALSGKAASSAEDDGAASSSCVVGTDGLCQDEQQRADGDDSSTPSLLGEKQAVSDEATAQRHEQMVRYVTETVYRNASYTAQVREECKNRHAQCTAWAARGECEANEAYMLYNCAPACFSCDQLDRSVRCAYDESAPKVWQEPGDLDRFFERIVSTQPNVTVLSGPADRLKALNISSSTVLPAGDGPWVLTLEHYLSDEECEHLIRQGEQLGFARSKGLVTSKDGQKNDVEISTRTSSNTWCHPPCSTHPVTRQIAQRLHQQLATPIPEANAEHWQLLKYTEGQEYKEHSDFIAHHLERAQGVRILTVFFYLNTAADGGGGTRFPALNLTVAPVRGRAVVWPSVLNEHPDRIDARTNHQALPALSTKYGANVWFHQRDYKTPYARSCQD